MGNVNSVANCSKCKCVGTVTVHRKSQVKLECPNCKHKWLTKSEICPRCQKSNGFAVPGLCSKCYVEGHRDHG